MSRRIVQDQRFNVTEEDIERGEARDQWNCAIAETIRRSLPTARRVKVNKKEIAFTIGEERYTYPTPPEAVEAVIQPLDTGGKPEPIILRLTGGTAEPVKHKDPDENLPNVRKYEKEIRTGQRPAPPSTRARQGLPPTEQGTSRTWNRFADQEKRGQKNG